MLGPIWGEEMAMYTPPSPFTWGYCGSVLPGLDLDPGLSLEVISSG